MGTRFQEFLEKTREASIDAKYANSPEYLKLKELEEKQDSLKNLIEICFVLLLAPIIGILIASTIGWMLGYNTFAGRGLIILGILFVLMYGLLNLAALNKRELERIKKEKALL